MLQEIYLTESEWAEVKEICKDCKWYPLIEILYENREPQCKRDIRELTELLSQKIVWPHHRKGSLPICTSITALNAKLRLGNSQFRIFHHRKKNCTLGMAKTSITTTQPWRPISRMARMATKSKNPFERE